MMTALFLLFSIAMLLAYGGKRHASVVLFLISLGLCLIWFRHHITDPLSIQL